MSSIEAIAFDKDGVIFDTEQLYKRSLYLAAEAVGIELEPDVHERMTGLTASKSLQVIDDILAGRMSGQEFTEKHWHVKLKELLDNEGVDFIPGAESLIETLYEQGYPLALVTSDAQENMLADFNRTRPDLLKYFSVVISVDDVVNPKPHPEPYQRAAVLLGVLPEQLLVVEDSDFGATAAAEAGAKVLLLSHGRIVPPNIADKVHRIIDTHSEVLQELS
ncbi:HAD family hydrolase [Suttonella ornithocola]|uniref:Phosphorylated carbohydrates phosphatase TM_1254 n=1 Tax=Suttonella ornithocola TaxID=279832 RepID=A0A380MRS1_9GAMM|nr:HAD family phosphatase [Suttonella ornithocola]SUO94603.1 Phosphorylated carbohydrates phosphatase TM_1254 [Suttonella ornithocola]